MITIKTGYGLKYNKTVGIESMKEFGRDQSLEQSRNDNTPDANGGWNKAYEDNSLKQSGMGESSLKP